MKNNEQNNKIIVILLVIILILLGVCGYFVYDKYIKVNKPSTPNTNELVNNNQQTNDNEPTSISDVETNNNEDEQTNNVSDNINVVDNKIIGFATVESINFRSKGSALVELDSSGNNRIIAKYSATDEFGNRQFISNDYVNGEGLIYSDNKIYFTVTKFVDSYTTKKTTMVYDLTTKEVKETTSKPADNRDYFDYVAFSNLYDTEKYPIYLNQNKISMSDVCLNFSGGGCWKHESKITYGDKIVCESNGTYACILLYSTDKDYIYYNLAGEAPAKRFKYNIATGETTDITYYSSDDSGEDFDYTEYDNFYKNLTHIYSYKTIYYIK